MFAWAIDCNLSLQFVSWSGNICTSHEQFVQANTRTKRLAANCWEAGCQRFWHIQHNFLVLPLLIHSSSPKNLMKEIKKNIFADFQSCAKGQCQCCSTLTDFICSYWSHGSLVYFSHRKWSIRSFQTMSLSGVAPKTNHSPATVLSISSAKTEFNLTRFNYQLLCCNLCWLHTKQLRIKHSDFHNSTWFLTICAVNCCF